VEDGIRVGHVTGVQTCALPIWMSSSGSYSRISSNSARGPLGLGTEFELIREYEPDDDIRQVNWRATARLGRPMSNQYRLEQDREDRKSAVQGKGGTERTREGDE